MTEKFINIFDGGIMLALSYAEAQALVCVLSKVGGYPNITPRGHIDRIMGTTRKALKDAGQKERIVWNMVNEYCGLYFTSTADGNEI